MDLLYKDYGEIYWDYAITFGKNRYTTIPIVKNKKVVGVIDAVQYGDKLYLLKNDKEEDILFFTSLIFDDENKLHFNQHYGEVASNHFSIQSKDIDFNGNKSTKSLVYKCSTKTIIVGCGTLRNCKGEFSRSVTSCRYQYDFERGIHYHNAFLDDDYIEERYKDYEFYRERKSRIGSLPFTYYDDDEDDDFDLIHCEKVDDKNHESKYADKINELNNNKHFNKKYETGYYEDINGRFNELTKAESTANSDGLNIPISQNTRGYIHTHQNDYESDDGEIRSPIRMFSPADVNAIMEIAKLREDGDYDDIYGTMVASNGIYTIKFTGTKENIKTGFDTGKWRKEYIEFFSEMGEDYSLETKFLRFMKEKMNIEGISLFKTNWRTKMVDEIKLNHKNIAKKHGC